LIDSEGEVLSRLANRLPQNPDLRSALKRLGVDGIAALLRDVPCLADAVDGRGPIAPGWPFGANQKPIDHTRFAQLLDQSLGIQLLLASLDSRALALAQLAAWYGGTLTREQAMAEAPRVDPAELDAAAQTLRNRLLTDRGGWLRLREAAVAEVDLPGLPAAPSFAYVRSEELADILHTLGQPVPPRKAERIDALVAALRDPDVIARVVGDLPADAGRVFAILVRHGPQRFADLGVPSVYGGRVSDSIRALLDRGLIALDVDEQECLLWLDTLVGFRGGRLFGDAFPVAHPPELVRLPGGTVSLPPVLEQLDTLLAHWQARAAEALAAGGLGVRPVRAAAKSLGMSSPHVGFLASLAIEIGLLGLAETGSSGRGRNRTVQRRWTPTSLLEWWRDLPPARRWAQLVHTWRDSPHLHEVEGLPERVEPDEVAPGITATIARAAWLQLLLGLPDGDGLPEDDLARVAGARFPSLLGNPHAVAGLLAATRALGLAPPEGPAGLTQAGRAVLAGPDALEAELPAPSTDIVVQADLTVIAPPDAAPEVTAVLARWADLESAAGARTYRLSERRLAAAMAAGTDDDEILGWLKEHSRVGVPQNVEYLIRDVARRRGLVRAGTAATYLRCDDPALLTQAVAVRAAKLRMLAPTVAVSPLTRSKLLAALADRGVAAVAEDTSGAVVDTAPPDAERVGWHHRDGMPALHPMPVPEALADRLVASQRIGQQELL
jgi:hypothetical protein